MLGRTNTGGGGGGLNFSVVGGTATPSNPKENMIWVNTSTAVTSWDFSATKPNRRSGNRNLIVYPFYQTTRTHNGITFTDNKDGTVSVSGTASGTASFHLSYTGADNGEVTLQPGTYTLGQTNYGSARLFMDYSYDNWATNQPQVAVSTTGPVTVTLAKTAKAKFFLFVTSGSTVSLTVKPQIEKGASATSFVKGDASGQVWVSTGAASAVEFNALKKNSLMAYPSGCKQYVNGSWVSKTAKTYQNDAWKSWIVYLIEAGTAKASIVTSGITATEGSGYMTITGTGTGYHEAYFENVNLSQANKMTVSGTFNLETGTNADKFLLAVWASDVTPEYNNTTACVQLTASGATLDVSSLSGTYKVGICTVYNYSHQVTNLYLA